MPVEEFPQLSKNKLARLLKLKQKKYREAEGKTLAEGINLIEQLFANGIRPLELICSNPDSLMGIIGNKGVPIFITGQNELAKLSDTDTPQSAVAVYSIPQTKLKDRRLVVYLDGIRDPGNLGTIIRTAAAFGLDGIILSPDSCEIWSPKVVRSSLGSVFWMPIQIAGADWLGQQKSLKIGLLMDGDTDLYRLKVDSKKPCCIIIGSESRGISPEVVKLLDQKVYIRINENMESLNASVAAGIAMYELSSRFDIDTKS